MSTSSAGHDAVPTESAPPALTLAERRRAIAASALGSTVEYYDFLLYAAAAGLVFPRLFFGGLDPALGLFLSYVTLFAGYVARPIGGLLFGHFGDKYGRKNVLFVTLLMMGLVSICVGLMPTAATIGVAAPITLAVLRIIQGLAVGGEWAGATLMAAEHSAAGSRGLGASFAVAGGPAGAVLATLVLALFAGLDDAAFLSWGWRVPFLLSFVVVLVGLYLRLRVTESPDFAKARAEGRAHTGVPLVGLFKTNPKGVLLGSLAAVGPLFLQGLLAVFMVPYVVATGAVERDTALLMLTLSNFLHIFTIPFFAWLSDRFGRKPVMLSGAVVSVFGIWGMFALFNSGDPVLIAVAFLVGNPVLQASMYGPIGAYLAELFDTTSRYTGVSITFQVSSVLGAGLAPLVAQRLVTPEAGTTHLAWYMVAMFLISAVAVLLSKETRRRQTRTERVADSTVAEA